MRSEIYDMELKVKTFDELNTRELYELLRSRVEIFVVEQKCPYQEVDGLDYQSVHCYYEEDGRVTAYLRAFPDETDSSTVHIGRVLTLKHGTGLGSRLFQESLDAIIEKMNPSRICMEAQEYAIGFYERYGLKVTSDMFLLDDIPHVNMELVLK